MEVDSMVALEPRPTESEVRSNFQYNNTFNIANGSSEAKSVASSFM